MGDIIIGGIIFIVGLLFGFLIASLITAASWEDESKRTK